MVKKKIENIKNCKEHRKAGIQTADRNASWCIHSGRLAVSYKAEHAKSVT